MRIKLSSSPFLPYIERIDHQILNFIPTLGPKTKLRDAMEYALLHGGGKRFRPAIILMMAEEMTGTFPFEGALAVEFFHTASLIADDLPCMDNEEMRRGKAALHRAFDEAVALLTTYALIAEGYKKIAEANKTIAPEAGNLALECAALNTGIFGATSGQFLDLYPPSLIDERVIEEIMRRKTGALFELSFLFGWLYGSGEPSMVEVVKKCAFHFGMAFQIADDLEDFEADRARNCKINFAVVCGEKKAKERLLREFAVFEETLQTLRLSLPLLCSSLASCAI